MEVAGDALGGQNQAKIGVESGRSPTAGVRRFDEPRATTQRFSFQGLTTTVFSLIPL
jgi:hypothetical protein